MRSEAEGVVNWPHALVEELADRRAVIVLGSGVTARSINDAGNTPPTWASLVTGLSTRCVSDELVRQQVGDLVGNGKFPQAAEEVRTNADPQSFARALRAELVDPKFHPSGAHNDVMTLDAPIVINLNYDRIFENQCIGFDDSSYVVTHYFQDDLVRNIRSPLRVILKLHGSVDDPQQIIFSTSDYARLRLQNKDVFEVIDAILKTRTVLFLGCGFNGDPDVDNLLTEAALAVPGAYPHYALVPRNADRSAFEAARARGLNVSFVDYPIDDSTDPHHEFDSALAILRARVLAQRELSI